MTEKRFECDKGSRIIIDNKTKLHYIMTLDWECSLVTKLLNRFVDENGELKKENFDLSKELDYYKAKCASLETGLFQADRENGQLKMENNSLKLLVQNWEALDEEKDEQLDKQNQALKKLKKENEELKKEIKALNDFIVLEPIGDVE